MAKEIKIYTLYTVITEDGEENYPIHSFGTIVEDGDIKSTFDRHDEKCGVIERKLSK